MFNVSCHQNIITMAFGVITRLPSLSLSLSLFCCMDDLLLFSLLISSLSLFYSHFSLSFTTFCYSLTYSTRFFMPLFSLQLFNSFYYCVSLFSSHSSLSFTTLCDSLTCSTPLLCLSFARTICYSLTCFFMFYHYLLLTH